MAESSKPFHIPSKRVVEETEINKFRLHVNETYKLNLKDFYDLHKWTIDEPSSFYETIWKRYNIIGDIGELPLFEAQADITDTKSFIPRARLNYAENALLGHANPRNTAKLAVIGAVEPSEHCPSGITRSLTFAELYDEVNWTSNALKKLGIKPSDKVSAYSSNTVEAVVAVLSSSALGGVFSSVSIELASSGCLDRLSAIKPKVLFATPVYCFNGQIIDASERIAEVVKDLGPRGLQHVVLVNHLGIKLPSPPKTQQVKFWTFEDFVAFGRKDAPQEIPFWRGPAMSPLWILFSSGTTGKPKGLIHNVAGMILTTKVANSIHASVTGVDLQMQASTLSWMMWNNAVNMLIAGSGIVTFDGSPLKDLSTMFDLLEKTGATIFGTSPRYLTILQNNNYIPNKRHNMKSLRAVLTAGSPLKPALYEYIRYSLASRDDLLIQNGTGGTDVCSALVTAVETLPVYGGIIQGPVLGVALESWKEEGGKAEDGVGTMTVTRPIPNFPLGLLDDPDKKLYKETYFNDYLPKVVWNMADSIIVDHRGVNVIGRADAILNPGGVRIGPSEIYEVVDPMFESIAVPLKTDADEKIALFIVTPGGRPPTEEEQQKIRTALKERRSFRHVPAIIGGVTAIPYNGSAKKLEVAVRKLINGMSPNKINTAACINPDCLKEYNPSHPALVASQKKGRSKL